MSIYPSPLEAKIPKYTQNISPPPPHSLVIPLNLSVVTPYAYDYRQLSENYTFMQARIMPPPNSKIHLPHLTLDEVSNSIVERSRTNLAAAICARLLSFFMSFCLLPVRCASSTISVPNWLKALTNSVKLVTPSSLPRLLTT